MIILPIVLAFIVLILIRNFKVAIFRNSLIDQIATLGKDWNIALKEYKSLSYEKMLFKFWKPLKPKYWFKNPELFEKETEKSLIKAEISAYRWKNTTFYARLSTKFFCCLFPKILSLKIEKVQPIPKESATTLKLSHCCQVPVTSVDYTIDHEPASEYVCGRCNNYCRISE